MDARKASITTPVSLSRKVLSPITQFLNYPNPIVTTPKSTRKNTRSGRARVLTSAEAIAIVEQKNDKRIERKKENKRSC